MPLDPSATTRGMSRGSRLDQQVFEQFWDDPERLRNTASAIRENLGSVDASEAESCNEDDEGEEAAEGRVLTRVHQYRERSERLRRKKKQEALRNRGHLRSEACGLDFQAVYGERGSGFMEVHHTIPVRDLKPGARTRLADLALLCANCHRMIHTKSPWLTVDELAALIGQIRARGTT